METKLINKINDFDDSKVVGLFMIFGEQLLSGLEEEDLTKNISSELKSDKHLEQIISLDPDIMLKNLSPAESAVFARNYLLYVAKDKNLSPLLEKAIDEYKEKPVLIVETILAIGFVASMLIFASSTELEGTFKNIKFKKNSASADLVKAIMEPFVKIIDKL